MTKTAVATFTWFCVGVGGSGRIIEPARAAVSNTDKPAMNNNSLCQLNPYHHITMETPSVKTKLEISGLLNASIKL